jgi:hypothetical protein
MRRVKQKRSSKNKTASCAAGWARTNAKHLVIHEVFCYHEAMHHDSSLKTAIKATLHCLTGCAIGEILGMVISTALNWNNFVTVAVSIVLSFIFGYSLSLLPIVKAGVPFKKALPIALASDTVSITSMEIVDNLLEIIIPGALAASLSSFLFWWSLALSLAVAFIITVPVNRYLIARGKGHALVHKYHQ